MSEMLELNRFRERSTLQEAADYLQGFRNAFASGPWTKEFAEASDHLIQSFRNAFTAAPGTKEFAEADRQMQRLRNLFAFAAPWDERACRS